MKKRLLSGLLAVLLLIPTLGLFSGCSSQSDLTYDLAGEPATLDPQSANDPYAFTVINEIFEGLTKVQEDGSIGLGVAESYRVSDDQLTYTFTLRDGLHWSNGYSCTANDFVFAFQRLLNPRTKSQTAHNFYCIKNATAVAEGTLEVDQLGVYANSDTELVIELESPNAFLLELLSTAPAMPCNEQFFNETRGEYGLKGAALISNSAYQADRWIVGSYIKLIPNQRYYDQDQIHLNSMVFWLCYSDTPAEGETQSEILTRFYDGDSVAYTCSGKPDEGLFDSSYTLTTHDNTVWGLTFNQRSTDSVKQQILNNQDFRLAIANCFDRSRYQDLLPEYLTVTDTIIPPGVSIDGSSYRDQTGDMTVYGLNSDSAKSHYQAMLNATGVQQVTGLSVLIAENDSVNNEQYFGYLSQVIQRELNLFLTVETVDQSEFDSRLANGNYDLAIVSLEADFDHPISILEDFQTGSAENNTGYSDSTLDSYLDQLYRGSDGEVGLCKLAEQHLLDSGIFLPLYYQTSYLAVDKSVSGVFLNPQNGAVDFRYARF
ncbi:MAG TPA: peptide ABC transporter substrate-binding protein [Candidatus Egerieicola faecale]|uniref:Peptide ABC transporter substrate-binding protein n=1 Tax=Candidatus Egerieicola faecale TaxID=2840774 RepID=A0A9D1IRM9_9FIRM|nr:peptide ABC transporter substrate-binding protein [Candidatus Egerieicola faecale]